ncbi:hypothetical protein LNN94_23670 [Klebsiella pneumoniae subsp. pneumoniae]|nr:hypothetical protein [Klebsiella pneumoniae subsp. pneumoniae]MDF5783239.1 hypothetical protein [Klebsiella pneumoniae]MDV3393136.1 hypothetical protein [Klebsiella pneumoniae]
MPEVVVEGEVQERAVHIQQNGIDLLPGDIKVHDDSPASGKWATGYHTLSPGKLILRVR